MEKILIIDDSVIQGAHLKSILEDEYDITVAQTAAEGLSLVHGEEYSLILSDIVMPDMDGFTLLKKLQEEIVTQSIPVILITGLSDIEYQQKGFVLGAVDYIIKPFNPLIVQARVNTHIKLYRYRRLAEQQSMIDQLTGIANRRRYEFYSGIKWKEAIRLQTPFSICVFDIDYFKAYNDTFGHPAGDKVIAAIADFIAQKMKRATDFVGRYGGEEFITIFMGEKARSVFEHVKNIRQGIEELHIPHVAGDSKCVTVSGGGITIVPEPDSDYDATLKIADSMLYAAKRFGRNQIVWCGDEKEQWREDIFNS